MEIFQELLNLRKDSFGKVAFTRLKRLKQESMDQAKTSYNHQFKNSLYIYVSNYTKLYNLMMNLSKT